MRFWIVERRQEVLTGDGMTVESIHALIEEYDTLQRAVELGKPDPIVVVLTDTVMVTPATITINTAGETSNQRDTRPDTPPQIAQQIVQPVPDPSSKPDTPARRSLPPRCDICGRTFAANQALASHRRSKHADVELTVGEREQKQPEQRPRANGGLPPTGEVALDHGMVGIAGELQAAPLNELCAACEDKFRLSDSAIPVEVRDARGGWVGERFYHPTCWETRARRKPNLPGPAKVPDLATNHVRAKAWKKRGSSSAGGGR